MAIGHERPKRTSEMVSVFQVNLKRMGTAMSLLSQAAREHGVDVLLISEQPWSTVDDDRRRSSQCASAQVVLTDSTRLAAITSFRGHCYVGVSKGDIVFAFCYLPPSIAVNQYASTLEELGEVCQRLPNVSLVIGGDFNARIRAGAPTERMDGASSFWSSLRVSGCAVRMLGQLRPFNRRGSRA